MSNKRMTSKEVCEYIPIGEEMLKRHRRNGIIPFYKLGHRTILYDKADIDAFIEATRVDHKEDDVQEIREFLDEKYSQHRT